MLNIITKLNGYEQNALSVNSKPDIAMISFFIVCATAYHMAPHVMIGALALIAGMLLVIKSVATLPIIVIYGYLTHSVIDPDSSRICFTIPVLIAVMWRVLRPHVKTDKAEIHISQLAVSICFLLSTVMIISEIVDPEVRAQGGDLGSRLIYIIIAIAIASTASIGKSLWPTLLSLMASAVVISLHTMWQVYIFGFSSLRLLFTEGKTANDPNYLALYLCLGLGPSLALAAFTELSNRLLFCMLAIASSISIIVGIILTTSRMGMLVIVILMIFVLFRLMITRPLKFILTLGSLAVFSIYLYGSVSVLPVFFEMTERWSSKDISTASDRTTIAIKALRAFDRMGIEQKLVGGGSQANYTFTGGVNTHNGFLEYLLDHGIIGVGFLVSLFVVSALCLKSITDLPLSVATWCVWITLLLCSFSLSPFVRAWGWVALAPLLVTTSKRQSSPQETGQ